jgi:flagellar hook-associated protein 1
MGTGALMSLGTRALFANQAAMTTIGNNIANANTAGYSRQSVEFNTAGGQLTGSGYFGKGVDVAAVTRTHNEYLSREVSTTRAASAADETRATQLKQLENLFSTGEDGIGYAAGQFLNSFVDVAANPQDASARQVALSRAEELAQRFRTAGTQIDTLQGGTTLALKTSAKQVTELALRVADMNDRIVKGSGSGHPLNDLLDQRDQLVREISDHIQVSTIEADDGSLNLFIGGGQRLVLGNRASEMTTMADPYDPARVQLALKEGGRNVPLPDGLVTGGAMAGLVKFQNTDLVDARNLLGQLAASISGSINGQQALGLDLRTPAGTGTDIFSVGPLQVTPANTNAKAAGVDVASMLDANGVRVPTVSMTLVNASELVASDYELQADPGGAAGVYQLKRLSDGLIRSVSSGAVQDGFRIDLAAPLPAANDRFLLQPVGQAAKGMQRVLDDPKGIAAASPVTASMGASNTGTASVASVAAADNTLNPNLTATLSFTSSTGNYNWELRDASSNALVSSGSATWQAGQPINLNGWSMQLAGVPANGDSLTVAKTAYPANNNGNARALVGLRDAGLVGQQSSGGVVTTPGVSITDAYADALANIGVRVQGANLSARASATAAANAAAANSNNSGVNLDEEAARLIQFQQSYQAAAKMLQVAQSVFDTLLQATSR